jgi:hypothetical protein
MTKVPLHFTCLLLIISLNLKAQDDITIYKKLFAYSDSLSRVSQKGVVSSDITNVLADLDKKHPASFFEKSSALLKAGQFNDASFVFYVGYFRYRYFNQTNPDYKPGDDGALFSSLNSTIGEPVKLFLRSDIDNFIKILDHTKEWLTNNDYPFNSKSKNLEKYKAELAQLDTLINNITTNKVKYKTQWAKEQKETRKAINEMEKSK